MTHEYGTPSVDVKIEASSSGDRKDIIRCESPPDSDTSSDASSTTSSSGSSSSSESSTGRPSPAASPVPLVSPLRDLASFDAWESSLLANLRFHGLEGFLEDGAEPKPPHIGSLAFAQWDERRKLAKGIIQCSAEVLKAAKRKRKRSSAAEDPDYVDADAEANGGGGVARLATAAADGYNPKIKNPRVHFDAAVACMVRRAAATGHTAALVQRLCAADRAQCESLAAYQHLLTDTRRRLARLRSDPGDAFLVWVALRGLQAAHPRWHRKLVAEVAADRLDWEGLMAAMAARACREKQQRGSSDVEIVEAE